jgi:hypothetical protein
MLNIRLLYSALNAIFLRNRFPRCGEADFRTFGDTFRVLTSP